MKKTENKIEVTEAEMVDLLLEKCKTAKDLADLLDYAKSSKDESLFFDLKGVDGYTFIETMIGHHNLSFAKTDKFVTELFKLFPNRLERASYNFVSMLFDCNFKKFIDIYIDYAFENGKSDMLVGKKLWPKYDNALSYLADNKEYKKLINIWNKSWTENGVERKGLELFMIKSERFCLDAVIKNISNPDALELFKMSLKHPEFLEVRDLNGLNYIDRAYPSKLFFETVYEFAPSALMRRGPDGKNPLHHYCSRPDYQTHNYDPYDDEEFDNFISKISFEKSSVYPIFRYVIENYPTCLLLQDQKGNTCLHENCNIETLKVVLQKCPAALYIQNNEKKTPLHTDKGQWYGEEAYKFLLDVMEYDIELAFMEDKNSDSLFSQIIRHARVHTLELIERYPGIENRKKTDGTSLFYDALNINYDYETRENCDYLRGLVFNVINKYPQLAVQKNKKGQSVVGNLMKNHALDVLEKVEKFVETNSELVNENLDLNEIEEFNELIETKRRKEEQRIQEEEQRVQYSKKLEEKNNLLVENLLNIRKNQLSDEGKNDL